MCATTKKGFFLALLTSNTATDILLGNGVFVSQSSDSGKRKLLSGIVLDFWSETKWVDVIDGLDPRWEISVLFIFNRSKEVV